MVVKRVILWSLFGLLATGCAVTNHTTAKTDSPPDAPMALPPPRYPSHRDWEEIEDRFKRTVLANPNDAMAHAELGRLQQRQRKLTASRSSLRRAVELAPGNPDYRRDYATVLSDLGEESEGLREMELALKQDKTNPTTLTAYGRQLRRMGRNAEAIAAFERAWNGSPPSATAGLELALWDIQRNQLSAAAGRLRVCKVHDPDSVPIRRAYAQVLGELGRDLEAIREWEALVQRGETGSEGYRELAKLYLRGGEEERALDSLASARRIDPRCPQIDAILREIAAGTGGSRSNSEFRSLIPSTSNSR